MDNNSLNYNNAYMQILNQEKTEANNLEKLIQSYSSINVSTKEDVVKLLNIALVDEFLAEFNYYASYNLSKSEGKSDFDPEFKQHEEEERDHRYKITNRLLELGETVPSILLNEFPQKNSNGLAWKQETLNDSKNILLNRYNEELNAVKFYGFIYSVLEKLPDELKDTTTERLIKEIKSDEETHAKDLKDLLVEYNLLENDLDK